MKKNIGPFLAFNRAFFDQHQKVLLCLLNAPIIKHWARWVLRVHRDIPAKVRISNIQPNSISFGQHLRKVNGKWRLFVTTDFRTHPKFGKRIYHAFRPVWWLLHFWDWLIADRFIPKWSYGFLTLTVYPDPDAESTSTDGYLTHSDTAQTWATIRAGAGTDANDTSAFFQTSIVTSVTSNRWDLFRRGCILFDTSALTAGATISAATLSLHLRSSGAQITEIAGLSLSLVDSAPASNTGLASGDYDAVGTTQYASDIAIASLTADAYNDFGLNATGLSNISKTGVTKMGTRISADRTNSEPTWGLAIQTTVSIYSADDSGTSRDPKLVVTYTTNTDWVKDLPETVTITDTLVKFNTRTLLETLTITDVLAAGRVFAKELLETLTITETLERMATKVLTETATITDALVKMGEKVLAETLTITDTITKLTTKVLSEVVTITDVIRKLLNGYATIYSKPTKHTPSYTQPSKNTPTYTKPSKSTTNYTQPDRN